MTINEQLRSLFILLRKEVLRFFRIWSQTLIPSVLTTILYFLIFGTFIGERIGKMSGFDYMQFMAPGLVILASNFKNNIDTAFTRRFQSIIEFEVPTSAERFKLWKNNLPKGIKLEESLSLESLAKKYSITGANIVNIIQYACLKTLAAGENIIKEKFLIEGVRREYLKEGKTL